MLSGASQLGIFYTLSTRLILASSRRSPDWEPTPDPSSRPIWNRKEHMHLALFVVLGLSIMVDLALGAWASVAWGSFSSSWFPNAAAAAVGPESRLLGLVLGLILIFFAAMQALALRWIRKEREGGYHFVVCFGGYLVVSSLVVFVALKAFGGNIVPLGGIEFLLIDGLRGAALVTFGLLAKNEPATVRELRLPENGRTSSGRTQSDSRSRDGRDREDRGTNRRGGRGRSNRDRNANRAPAAAGSRNERSSSGGRDSRRERSGAAGGSEQRERRNAGGRDNRRSRGETHERARATEAVGGDVAEADRSLTVVVRGDFRGEAGGADDSARDSGEAGDRRRRRRGGRGRRRGGPGEGSAGEVMSGDSGSATSAMFAASAPRESAQIGRNSRGEGLDVSQVFDRADAASDRGSSEFGRSRRPAGARRK